MASPQSLSALLQNATLSDHEEILKAANNVLKKSKTDKNAHHARLVALLKLDRYDDALKALEEGGDELRNQAKLEWAYALYKTGDLEQAEVVARDGRGSQDMLYVEGQTAYRSEQFQHAADVYEKLLSASSNDGDMESDLRINKRATDAQLAWARLGSHSTKLKLERGDLEQLETAFNTACCHIARGEIKEAEHKLRIARDLCLAADELTDDQKQAELLPIYVQQIFVFCRLGDMEKAEALGNEIKVSGISEKVTRHIAQNNVLVASIFTDNPYLAHRMFHSDASLAGMDAPFQFQHSILQGNSLALDLQANKFGSVKKSTMKMATDKSSRSGMVDTASLGTFRAAAEAKCQTGKSAIKQMLPLLERRPDDIGLILTIVQLYTLTDNIPTATNLLESFLIRLEQSSSPVDQDARFIPGLVATLISLYARQNRIAYTKAEVAKASMHWRRRSRSQEYPASLLLVAGAVLLESPSENDFENARLAFATVHEQYRGDMRSYAGILACSDKIDASVKQFAGRLPPVDKLIAGVDAAALEDAGVARPDPRPVTGAAGTKRPAEMPPKPAKSRKIRKSRLPKDYDPNRKPDPERWLPLRERSSWRPKGKKKGRGGAGGMATQGGIVSEDSRPSTPSQQVQKPSAPAKQKKKKGKGGK